MVTRTSTRLPGWMRPERPMTLSPFMATARFPGFTMAHIPPAATLIGASFDSRIGSLVFTGVSMNAPDQRVGGGEMPVRKALFEIGHELNHFREPSLVPHGRPETATATGTVSST